MSVLVRGMKGLGDNIYQRAFVKTLARSEDVYLMTPWPELYEDLPRVRFVRQDTPLRTQSRNIARQPATRWVKAPAGIEQVSVSYGSAELRRFSIPQAMQRCFGCEPEALDLPPFPRVASVEKPIAVVRPVTERREWLNTARNPHPEYVARIAENLMRDHHVVSVADLEPGVEWLVGSAPPAHIRHHAGELDVRELLGLIQSARVVVGGVGWILPACIATGVPLFCILGGNGGHNAPWRTTETWMNLEHIGFAEPDRFCHCESMRHNCDRHNSRLDEQWAQFRWKCGL